MEYKLIHVNGIPVYARVASTPRAREQGLMGIDRLGENEGCLFIFGSDQHAHFWMKNCKINLQGAAIDRSGKIVDIFDMKYQEPYRIHRSSCPVSYFLEVPENFLTNHGIKTGDIVKI